MTTLVFRSDQTTPLTNDQLDNNFKYLRDQNSLKYNTSDFTAANISLKLRTTASGQNSLSLAESNAINSWKLRDLDPSSTLPTIANKSSIVSRNTLGDIEANIITGSLNGNAASATLAASATKLATSRNINGVAFDGTAAITIVDATRLPLSGGTMTGKLSLIATTEAYAPLNLGATTSPNTANKINGDIWVSTTGIKYHLNGQTDQIANIDSPTFTGIPRAPGYFGASDQIITLSHLENSRSALATTIALKSNIDSPTFTGIPRAPNAIETSNDTQISNTSFVKTAVNNIASSLTNSYQTYTNSAIVSLSNSVNVLLSYKANVDSPVFTGTPIGPTAPNGNNSKQLANTEFINNAIATLTTNFNASISALQDALNSTRPIPAGTIFYTASSIVPYGYFEPAGQTISTLTYRDLWLALGSPAPNSGDPLNTFRLPDLRAEFIRCWDHGRGIDTNRNINTWQYSSIQTHSHSYVDTYYRENSGSGGNGPGIGSRATDGDNYDYNYDRITGATGDSETRPRNIALMAIIKW